MNLKTSIGRLRLIAWLEGTSLIILVLLAVPMKYIFQDDSLTRMIGPIHGAFFLVFVFNAISVAVQYQWSFRETTWKVLLACLIPFGTYYIDKKILSKLA